MKITVKYTAQAKLFAGTGHAEVEVLDGANITDLVKTIASQDNPALSNLLVASDGTPRSSYLVFIGDRCLRGNSQEILKPNDEVTIMSMISGG